MGMARKRDDGTFTAHRATSDATNQNSKHLASDNPDYSTRHRFSRRRSHWAAFAGSAESSQLPPVTILIPPSSVQKRKGGRKAAPKS